MKSKMLKRILLGLLTLFIIFCLLMATPRTIAALFPAKPPVGYKFLALDYLAVLVGLEKLVDRSPEITADIEEIKNIEYKSINGKSLQIDMYRPRDNSKPAPLLVFIHGGGWKGGERSDYLVYLVPFAKKGYVTATVSYRLIQDGTYPACIEDITDAVKWFFRNGDTYGYDPDKIALIGGSAGGHLSLLAGYGWESSSSGSDSTSSFFKIHKIKAVVDFYGPADLTTEYGRNHDLVTGLLGKRYEEAPEKFKDASPMYHLDKNDPPTLIFQGSSDNLVPASQSVMLKEKLDSLGIPAELYCLPLWPHTMDIVQRVNDFSQDKMNTFFNKYLMK
jgi:acetyl esterase/lipase